MSLLLMLLPGCADYDAGYKAGYTAGHAAGYSSGTRAFVKGHAIPSVGLAILVVVGIGFLFIVYCFGKDPFRRIVERAATRKEEGRQRDLLRIELERKKLASQEEAHARANQVAADLYEESRKALGDSRMLTQLENCQHSAAKTIFNIQMREIDNFISCYERATDHIDNANHLSANERATLYSELSKTASRSLKSGKDRASGERLMKGAERRAQRAVANLRFPCPKCGDRVKAPAELAGKNGSCLFCETGAA